MKKKGKSFIFFAGMPDDPDPNGKYDDSGDADDEEATCPEDFGS